MHLTKWFEMSSLMPRLSRLWSLIQAEEMSETDGWTRSEFQYATISFKQTSLNRWDFQSEFLQIRLEEIPSELFTAGQNVMWPISLLQGYRGGSFGPGFGCDNSGGCVHEWNSIYSLIRTAQLIKRKLKYSLKGFLCTWLALVRV